MGITGLLPFLEKASKRCNVQDFSGGTVAIDAYCWLHKGAFACADQLVLGQESTIYVTYCMKFVTMLLSYNIKPILVFDGRNLPAKAGTESKRRENRELNKKKGAALLRAGQVDKGRHVLKRAVDVTHEMALKVMKECRRRNVDCIVAPYEADAQLAYFSLNGFADVIITEDSDLLLFGCKKVLFKMDLSGNGTLVERDLLHLAMNVRFDNFSFDKFRYMCILSGCDYLASLPGIGLTKACKFVVRCSEQDIEQALLKLPSTLNMWSLTITDEYRRSFLEADATFRCQLVFDPVKRQEVPLTEPRPGETAVGVELGGSRAFQLALGNLHPKTLQVVDNFNPDVPIVLNKIDKGLRAPHKSIWSAADYVPKSRLAQKPSIMVQRCLSFGKVTPVAIKTPKTENCDEEKHVDLLEFYSKASCDKSYYVSESESEKEEASVLDCQEEKEIKKSMLGVARTSNECCSSRYFSSKSPEKSESQKSLEEESLVLSADSGLGSDECSSKRKLEDLDLDDSYEERLSQEENLSIEANKPSCKKKFIQTVESETSVFFHSPTPIDKPKSVRGIRAGLSNPKKSQQCLLSKFGFVAKPKIL